MADSIEIETFIAEKLAGISLQDEVRLFFCLKAGQGGRVLQAQVLRL